MQVLDHEKLDVYQVVRALSSEVCQLRKRIRAGRPDLVDQVLRATASVPLNIAEGNGERLAGRRAYFFRIARSSATEISAALDHLVDMGLLEHDRIIHAKTFIVRIVAMLTRMTEPVSTPDSYPPLSKTRRRP